VAQPGRGYANHPVVTRTQRHEQIDATAALGAFSLAVEFPQITVSSPSVAVGLGSFSLAVEFPALHIPYAANVGLGAFSLAVEFPAFAELPAPIPGALITADGQIEYNGVLWGAPGSVYSVGPLSGWDERTNIDSGTEEWPNRHGAAPGHKLARRRLVSAVIRLRDDSPTFAASRRAFRRATTLPRDDTEYPLVIRTRGETLLAYGVMINAIESEDDIGVGACDIAVQWECSDAARYDPPFHDVTIPVGGSATADNDGNTDSRPRVRFRGPLTNPVIVNETTERQLAFNVVIGLGSRLEVDCLAGLAQDDLGALHGPAPLSVPIDEWALAPGDNSLAFSADAGGGHVEVFWRSAWL
jgi:hypothetical protein